MLPITPPSRPCGTDATLNYWSASSTSIPGARPHRKAKAVGFREFWTIIAKSGLDVEKLKRESPTTDSWFDATQVLDRNGPDWEDFRRRLAGHVGIVLRSPYTNG